MNYGGFAKILKKHDKNTNFITQERYLRRVVNVKKFALYSLLKEAIGLSENSFTRLVNMIPQGTDMFGSSGGSGSSSPLPGFSSGNNNNNNSSSSSSSSSNAVDTTRHSPTSKSPVPAAFSADDASTLSSLRSMSEQGQQQFNSSLLPAVGKRKLMRVKKDNAPDEVKRTKVESTKD